MTLSNGYLGLCMPLCVWHGIYASLYVPLFLWGICAMASMPCLCAMASVRFWKCLYAFGGFVPWPLCLVCLPWPLCALVNASLPLCVCLGDALQAFNNQPYLATWTCHLHLYGNAMLGTNVFSQKEVIYDSVSCPWGLCHGEAYCLPAHCVACSWGLCMQALYLLF